MRTGIADVHAERRATVAFDDTLQTRFYGIPCLCPGHFDVLAVTSDHRRPQAIRVGVQLFQRRALRADEPLGEHVVHIALNALDLLSALAVRLERDLETTGGFTEWAGPPDRARRRGGSSVGCAFEKGHGQILAEPAQVGGVRPVDLPCFEHDQTGLS